MVKLFLGEAGSGKTKKMLEMANTEAETTTGEILLLNIYISYIEIFVLSLQKNFKSVVQILSMDFCVV